MESHNEYHCSNCKWIRRSENRAFFIKRQEKKEGKSKNHHDYVQKVIKEWSELQITNKLDKNPFFENLCIDIFDIINKIDSYNEASSHIKSAKDTDYKNCYNNYKTLEQLQISNNEIIKNYIKKLEEKISEITNNNKNIDINNLINYIIGQFLNKNLHNNQNIDSEIVRLKENHPDVIIKNYEETDDIDNPGIENSYKLSSQEKLFSIN